MQSRQAGPAGRWRGEPRRRLPVQSSRQFQRLGLRLGGPGCWPGPGPSTWICLKTATISGVTVLTNAKGFTRTGLPPTRPPGPHVTGPVPPALPHRPAGRREGAARATSPFHNVVARSSVARAAHPPPSRGPRPDASRESLSRHGPGNGRGQHRPARRAGQPRHGTSGPGAGPGADPTPDHEALTLRPPALAKSPFTSALPDVHGCLLTRWTLVRHGRRCAAQVLATDCNGSAG